MYIYHVAALAFLSWQRPAVSVVSFLHYLPCYDTDQTPGVTVANENVRKIIITHMHPFNGPFSGTTRVSRYQKGKPIWILLEQETVRVDVK